MGGWQKLWQNPEIAKQWAERPPAAEVVEVAERLAAEGRRRALDVGCGMGRHTVYLAARGWEVTAVDNAPAALTACREHLAEAGLTATVQAMEMTALEFAPASFEAALSTQVIHHARVAVIAEIIGRITEALVPRGYFVWSMPSADHGDWGKGEEIEPGTWVDPNHREGPVPHHFCSLAEIGRLLSGYELLSLRKEDQPGADVYRSHWFVLAQKK